MKILEAFEKLPLSERTIIRHRFDWGKLRLMNNRSHPCEYTIFDRDENKEIGMVKYYKGRKLACYQLQD